MPYSGIFESLRFPQAYVEVWQQLLSRSNLLLILKPTSTMFAF